MSVTVLPSYRWSPGPQDLIAGLALTAAPTARVDEASIGTRELIVADLQTIAGTAVVAPHFSYSVPAGIAVAAHTEAQIVVDNTITGAVVGQFVACTQPSLAVLVYGTVTAPDTVELRARNLFGSSQTLAAATPIRYILL